MKKIIRYSWPPLIIALVIFYLCCLIPLDDIPEDKFHFFIPTDKIVHFVMYFGLSIVAALSYICQKNGHIIVLKLILCAVLLPIVYGGLVEIIQYYCIEGRGGDWYDFLADALGSLSALPFALWYRRYLLNKQQFEI